MKKIELSENDLNVLQKWSTPHKTYEKKSFSLT